MLEIEWGGEKLLLFAERAIYWPKEATLFLADLHLGKAATFRAWGIPVPDATTTDDLARLGNLLDHLRARRLVILGDLIHHKKGRVEGTMEQFGEWRALHGALEVILIQGNHDRHAGDPPEGWRIQVHRRPLELGPFQCVHEPCARPRRFTLCGHLHPAVILRDWHGELRMPCFLFGRSQAILPAFTEFSGSATVRPRPSDRIFLIGPDGILEYKNRRV